MHRENIYLSAMENQDIRWVQRFENFCKANDALQRALEIEHPSEVERGGIVQFAPQLMALKEKLSSLIP